MRDNASDTFPPTLLCTTTTRSRKYAHRRACGRVSKQNTHMDGRVHHSHGEQGNAASKTHVKTRLETRAYSGLPEELLRSIGI